MNMLTRVGDVARFRGDPQVLKAGANVRSPADRVARALGWFSIGLGAIQMLAPRTITRLAGVEGNEALLRTSGARSIGTGVMALSITPKPGIAGRIGGDLMDIGTLLRARNTSAKRRTVDLALAAVIGVTILDVLCYQELHRTHARTSEGWRDYSGRSGLPRGIKASRGLARATGSVA